MKNISNIFVKEWLQVVNIYWESFEKLGLWEGINFAIQLLYEHDLAVLLIIDAYWDLLIRSVAWQVHF